MNNIHWRERHQFGVTTPRHVVVAGWLSCHTTTRFITARTLSLLAPLAVVEEPYREQHRENVISPMHVFIYGAQLVLLASARAPGRSLACSWLPDINTPTHRSRHTSWLRLSYGLHGVGDVTTSPSLVTIIIGLITENARHGQQCLVLIVIVTRRVTALARLVMRDAYVSNTVC